MQSINELKSKFRGEIFTDNTHKIIYSTDASVYREMPGAVAYPKTLEDIKMVINFSLKNSLPIISRGAGTSLAGQVVGNGIILDFSKYMNTILEINPAEQWIRVQPGVILDEMNKMLSAYELFFSPEASTANRCTIGGMLGNNACGLHSLIYGSTREHTISVKALLSDASEVEFTELSKSEFQKKMSLNNLEGNIYKNIYELLSNQQNIESIQKEFPEKNIKRRNTGYAVDLLIENEVFTQSTDKFNFAKLIAGSEGTLCIVTEIKLKLTELPPPAKAIMAVHFNSLEESFLANLIALKYSPSAVELMDNKILECTKGNIEQQKNRFFVEGNPAAILMIEFYDLSQQQILLRANAMKEEMMAANYGYHFPIIFGADTAKVWNLRKAGLGVLSNVEGDAKPVSVTEDTAVAPEKLAIYMTEFKKILEKYNLECVYHAHIGTGELHLRPLLNLKSQKDIDTFRNIAEDTALLVKKYNGSLSGEHGDGRLRAEFLPIMIGEQNYNLLKNIKLTWDKYNIFNPNKIFDAPPMNTSLRYDADIKTKDFLTIMDFSKSEGFMRSVEKCNGSADCRKTHLIGGTMCPSFMATHNETNSTRARANLLREILTRTISTNPFDNEELYLIMDSCLSCKACKAECPSGIDMAKFKAEFLYNYYKTNHIPLRTRMIANLNGLNKIAIHFPKIYNFLLNTSIANLLKKTLKFEEKRSLPKISQISLEKWYQKYNSSRPKDVNYKKTVYLFCDEFTNFNEATIGIKAVELLFKLGYNVVIPKHLESGRTYFSKGLLDKAKSIANQNVSLLKDIISDDTPLIGIEPSAILCFRDEYPEIVEDKLKDIATTMSRNCLMFDEFFCREIENKNINSDSFTTSPLAMRLHGHCQQKSIASTSSTLRMLSFPKNYKITEIPSGCCGMAGAFGYEKEHYQLSVSIANLVLVPEINKTDIKTQIVATGTSCRTQIKDCTNRVASHPIEIMWEALL